MTVGNEVVKLTTKLIADHSLFLTSSLNLALIIH